MPWAVEAELAALRRAGQFRRVQVSAGDDGGLDFASNDYLGLARDPRVCAGACEAIQSWGCGATGSRLMSGTLGIHETAERRLADWLGYPAGLVFGSGFLANLGTIGALCDKQTVVFEDRLNHASLIDGARLSGARLVRYRHADVDHLRRLLRQHDRAPRRLVVTDTLFSMDGDQAPLEAIAGLCAETGAWWMADEAHALGVLGPRGRGCCVAAGLRPDLLIGTFSKALGSYGGFVVCSSPVRDLLVNRARGLIFTTGLAPACLGAALAALDIARSDAAPGQAVCALAEFFRDRLARAGLDAGRGRGPIIPVVLGDNTLALNVSQRLRAQGLLAPAIRPPTVPPGTARLRLSVTLRHNRGDLERAATLIGAAVAAGSGRQDAEA